MKVAVKIFPFWLRQIVGTVGVDVELEEGSTLEGLIKKMIALYGSKFETNVWHADRRMYLAVTVNGVGAGLNRELKNGDTVAFVLPAAGGCGRSTCRYPF